jgi:hypothetical protein
LRINQRRLLLFLPLLVLVSGCTHQKENRHPADQTVQKKKLETYSIQFFNRSQIVVAFYDSFFIAQQINKIDTTSISIPYSVDKDKRILCNECIRIRSKSGDSLVSGMYLSDSLFLLPILDFAGKLRLFGLDFQAKASGKSNGLTEVLLMTTLNAFIISPEEETIIVTDGIYSNEKGLVTNVMAHKMSITGKTIHNEKDYNLPVPSTVQDQDSLKNYLMNQLLKKK